MGPIDPAVVRRLLEEHDRFQRERAGLMATLARLAGAEAELRSALNDLNQVLG